MILILFSCLLFGVNAQEKDVYRVPPAQMPILIETSLNCISETGADADSLQQIVLWKVQDTQTIKDFLYCMMHKIKFADDNGHIVKSKMLDLLKTYDKKQDVGVVIDQCNTLQGKDTKDTLFKSVSCFHIKSPVEITMLN